MSVIKIFTKLMLVMFSLNPLIFNLHLSGPWKAHLILVPLDIYSWDVRSHLAVNNKFLRSFQDACKGLGKGSATSGVWAETRTILANFIAF